VDQNEATGLILRQHLPQNEATALRPISLPKKIRKFLTPPENPTDTRTPLLSAALGHSEALLVRFRFDGGARLFRQVAWPVQSAPV
jgi:hypothetical protein